MGAARDDEPRAAARENRVARDELARCSPKIYVLVSPKASTLLI